MHFRRRNTESDLEQRLRAERPQPRSGLIHQIGARTDRGADRSPRSLRVAFAVASTGALVALVSVGGVSYAASSVQHATKAVKEVFVAKPSSKTRGESKANGPFKIIANAPSKTAAGDQYGPFLPPDTTPTTVLERAKSDTEDAVARLRALFGCNKKTGAAKAACEEKVQAYINLQQRLLTGLQDAEDQINALTGDKRSAAETMLAIQLQQRNALLDAQAARRSSCAGSPSSLACRNLAEREAQELLKLTRLQLSELQTFLAG